MSGAAPKVPGAPGAPAPSNVAAAARLLGTAPAAPLAAAVPTRPAAPLAATLPPASAPVRPAAPTGTAAATAAANLLRPPPAVAKSDDAVLSSFLSKDAKATLAPSPPPPPSSSAPPPPGPPLETVPNPVPPVPPPGTAAMQAERDASVIGRALEGAVLPPATHGSAAPAAASEVAVRDSSVLDSFLRKHGAGGPSVVPERRAPAPISTSSLDSTPRKVQDDAALKALVKESARASKDEPSLTARRDDAVLAQIMQHPGTGPGKSPKGASRGAGNLGGYPSVAPGRKSFDEGGVFTGGAYGMPVVARRPGQPQRPRGISSGGGAGRGARQGAGAGGRGAGSRTKVQRDIIEERANPDIQDENQQLRRSAVELRGKISQLETKIRSMREDPWEAQAMEQKASDLEQLQRALSLPGPFAAKKQKASTSPGARRGTRGAPRQQSQRRAGGGRLRGRMTVTPWGQAPAVHDPYQGSQQPLARSSVSPQLRASQVPELSLPEHPSSPARLASSLGRNTFPAFGSHAAQALPGSPVARQLTPRAKPASPIGSNRFGSEPVPPLNLPEAKEPAPLRPAHTVSPVVLPPQQGAAASVDQQLLPHNRQQAEELRQRNRELSGKLDELLVGRISQQQENARYKDKAKVKDAQIRALEAALQRQREKVQKVEATLQEDSQRLYTEVAVLKTELHHAQVLAGGPQDTAPQRARLAEVQAESALVSRQIRELTVRAFSSTADQRMISEQRMKELEEFLARKTEESEKLVLDHAKVEEEKEQVVREVADLEQRCRSTMEENERFAVRLDEKAEAVRRAQSMIAGILDSLSEEDRKVMVYSLQFLREREEKAAAEVAARVAAEKAAAAGGGLPAPPVAPSPPGAPPKLGPSIEEMTRKVDALRAEKDELAQELRSLQDICQRERDITKDLRNLHRIDCDELGLQIQVTMADTERCKKLSEDREKRIKDLQLQLVKRKEQALAQPGAMRRGPVGSKPEVVSDGGFSELSDVALGKNILDLYVTVARIEERALLELPQRQGVGVAPHVPEEQELVTLVLAEFMNCDVGCSETSAGLRPRYDSLLSFGAFEVGDAEIEHFARGAVRLELQAFSSSGTSAHVVGRASLPLAALLDCTPQDTNPVVAGTLCFASEVDTRVQIATVRYKARWRKSIMQQLQAYTLRRGMSPSDVAAAFAAGPAAGAGVKAAAGLMDAAKALVVHVANVTSLVPARPGIPPEMLQPYVSYEVPGQKEHFTKTGNGPNVSFEDVSRLIVRVDTDFCRWAEGGGGLPFMVFDAAAPPAGETEEQLGLIGEVRVPLSQLLTSPFAQLQGRFPLRRGGPQGSATELPPVGYMELSIKWQDDASTVLAPAAGGPTVAEADYFGMQGLTDEQYQVTWQRVLRRLHVLSVAPVDWFYKYDADKDGFWSKQEGCAALSSMPIGLSVIEMEQVFNRMDVRRRGLVTLDNLAAAFEEGKKAAPLEQWARDAYRRVAEALQRQGWTPQQAFDAVTPHRRAQKREFFALITSLDMGLRVEQLEWLWKLSDTNSDGLLDFSEFVARLSEVTTGSSTTAFTVPKPSQDVSEPPETTVSSAEAAAAMSEAWHDVCLGRLLKACQDSGWKTVDKAVEHLPTREDGLAARAELMAFVTRCRARLSDWELDKMFAKLDGEMRGAIPPRELRTALLRADVIDSPAQATMRRANDCMSAMHQGLLTYRPATTVSALRTLLSEVAAQKEPLVVQREELAAAALRLGTDKVWMDELWFSVPKLRDNSLDIEALGSKVAAAPLPGEGSVDELTDEHCAILLGRLKKALDKYGGAEKAFHSFRTGSDGCLSRAELEAALADTTKDICSAHERMLLVRRIDKNDDGRISLKELEEAVASAKVSAIAMGSWAEDVCARVSQALQREGRTVDELFEALAGGQGKTEVHWTDFRALFSQLDPTLTDGQLKRLWQLFDKNGDGGVSRDEFHRALAPAKSATAGLDASVGVAPKAVLASRIGRILGQSRLSAVQALSAYGSGSLGLDLNAWLDACRGLGLPLSRNEATSFHASLARGVGSGYVTAEAIEAEASRANTQGVPEERWAREFVSGRAQLAADAGAATPSEAVQAASGGAEAVDEEIIRTALGRHCAIPDETWAQLRLLMDRRLDDGFVLWRQFLQWACGLGAGAPLAGSVPDDVCARVVAALRREKKSVDELFDALAGVKAAVHWQDFSAFFSQVEQSLTQQQLEQLWQSFDKNGDGSVSKEEFSRRFAEVDYAASSAVTAVCARVSAALKSRGTSVDELFDALAGVKAVVHWPDFKALFAQWEPTLREEQLEHLWRTFDTDGDGGITRAEFRKALLEAGVYGASPVVTQPAAKAPKATPDPLQEVCRQVTDLLEKQGKTSDELFDALVGGKTEVTWPDFKALFQELEPSLQESQLQQLWRTFDTNSDGGVSREEFKKALSNAKATATGSAPKPSPKAKAAAAKPTATEEICSRVASALRRQGKSEDQLFDALADGRAEVKWPDFQALFSQIDPTLTEAQLKEVWRDFDKNGDGGVSRDEFKRALGAVGSAANDVAKEVCGRVTAALSENGKSVDTLFDALSGGSTKVKLDDFAAFFTSLEPSLTKQQLEMLWRTFDKDNDGSVSRAEFQDGLSVAPAASPKAKAASKPAASVSEVCVRVAKALKENGKTVDELFDALSAGKAFVVLPDFKSLFAQLEPSLSETDLESLWSTFDKDGDGGVTRDEFTKGLAQAKEMVSQMPPVPPPETVGPPELADALWSAIAEVAILRANGLPRGSPALQKAVVEQLSAFDAARSGSLDKAAFCKALQSYSPSLPEAAVEVLWKQADADGKADIEKLAERLLRSPKPPPPTKTAPNAPASDRSPVEAGGPLWSALRRIRPALHEKSIYLSQAFKSWLPQGVSKLTKSSLGARIASLVGGELPEPQLTALYAAMTKDPETGATMEDFVAAFGGSSGEGFEAFGRELLGRFGRSLRARAKGSLSQAFAIMDMDGSGEIRIAGFTAAMRTFGDLNLESEQVEKLWELAKTIGGQKGDAMEFAAFKTVFGATSAAAGSAPETPAAASTSKLDAGPSLEESCVHFERLDRLEKLKAAILGRNPDGFLALESLASAIREAASELTDEEVSQLCRLAPQKGGVLHGEDAYAYDQLVERFEDGHKDYHPLHARDRRIAADMCRYVDQRSQAWGFASLALALGDTSEALPVHVLMSHLQRFLPQPPRDEDRRVVELHLLRLGRPLSGGSIDAAEFCQRFDLLARGGAAAGAAPLAPVDSAARSEDSDKVFFCDRPCPVDITSLGLVKQAQVAARLRQDFPEGTADFYKLVEALQAELKKPPTAREQDQLKKWLQPAPSGLVRWPMLLGFQVTVEKLAFTAGKELRKMYPQIQLSASFCGRELRLKKTPWKMGIMCLSTPNTMELSPKWHVIWSLDGPSGLPPEDLSLALSETPEPPATHRLRLAIHGFRESGGSEAESKELGACELCASYDLPSTDLRPSDGQAERHIECSAAQAGLPGPSDGTPALRATVVLSTRRAGRLRERAGGGVSGA